MNIELTEEQQQLLDSLKEEPPRVIDPRTNAAYILLRVEDYESIRELLEEEKQQTIIHAIGRRNAIGHVLESDCEPV